MSESSVPTFSSCCFTEKEIENPRIDKFFQGLTTPSVGAELCLIPYHLSITITPWPLRFLRKGEHVLVQGFEGVSTLI